MYVSCCSTRCLIRAATFVFGIGLGFWTAATQASEVLVAPGKAVVAPAPAATSTGKSVVKVGKRNRLKAALHRPLQLTLPSFTFSSAAPATAVQGLPPTVLLEPYEPARFQRFGPSLLRPASSLATSLRFNPAQDESLRLNVSPDWNLQWDLLQTATPAAGHQFGLNIGLHRKF